MLVNGVELLPLPYEGLLTAAVWVVALVPIARDGRATLARGSNVRPTWARDGDESDDSSAAPAGPAPEVSD